MLLNWVIVDIEVFDLEKCFVSVLVDYMEICRVIYVMIGEL